MTDDPYITQAQLDRLVALEHRARKNGVPGLGPLIDGVAREIERMLSGMKPGEQSSFSLTCGFDGITIEARSVQVPTALDGPGDSIHEAQCRVYWDLLRPIDKEMLGVATFEEYRRTIPPVPAEYVENDPDFPLLVLVEPRRGLKRLCDIADISIYAGEEALIGDNLVQPAWIRVQDGRKNRGLSVWQCRTDRFLGNEYGLTALEGACTCLQHPDAISTGETPHIMDLPGTVERENRSTAVCIGKDDSTGQIKIAWKSVTITHERHGSASRRSRL